MDLQLAYRMPTPPFAQRICRQCGLFDVKVIDFDAATRDPANPTRYLPAYDSGDHLHPNDAGYQAMANAIDLALFKGAPASGRTAGQ
jgi:lysophospholipase L1-like esterase